jgi:hypothetical protein
VAVGALCRTAVRALPRALAGALLLAFTLAEAAPRSPAIKAEFRKANPCPATGRKTGACPGWEVDHRQALVCGGADTVDNLQWLPVAEHREKTRAEVKLCRTNRHTKQAESVQ